MTPDQKMAVQAWIDAALPVVLLSDWKVIVEDGVPEDPSAWAMTNFRHHADVATLSLGPGFWNEGPEERRASLAHELVHLHLARLHTHIGDLTARLGKEAEAVADKAAERLEELAVERLSQVIARLLPIPELP